MYYSNKDVHAINTPYIVGSSTNTHTEKCSQRKLSTMSGAYNEIFPYNDKCPAHE